MAVMSQCGDTWRRRALADLFLDWGLMSVNDLWYTGGKKVDEIKLDRTPMRSKKVLVFEAFLILLIEGD